MAGPGCVRCDAVEQDSADALSQGGRPAEPCGPERGRAELTDRRPRRALLVVALVVGTAYGAGSLTGWGSPVLAAVMGDFGLSAAAALAMCSCLARARMLTGRARLSWALFGLACAAVMLGNLVWGWYEVVWGQRVPTPSLADAAFLCFGPLAVAGIVFAARGPNGVLAWLRRVLDGWLIAGSLFTLAWTLALARLADSQGDDPVRMLFVLAYPTMDILLISVVLGLRFRTPRRDRAALNLAVSGLAVTVLSDGLWTSPQLRGTYHSGELLDAGWFLGSLLLACAPWVGGRVGSAPSERSAVFSQLGLIAPYLSATVCVVGVVCEAALNRSADPVALVVAGGVLLGLIVRQGATLVENLRLTRELVVREDHFRTLVQGSRDVITIAGLDGTLRYVSPAVRQVYGYSPEELLGGALRGLIHPGDVRAVIRLVAKYVGRDGPADQSVDRVSCRVRTACGSWRHTESTISRHADGLIINSRDVSERVALQTQLEHSAFHDALTGLPNRALLSDRISHALAQRGVDFDPPVVLFADLDGFKAVNDTAGHAAGDELLVQAADRLRRAVRAGDSVARFGGDEFAALLEGEVGPEVVRDIAERLLGALARPYRVGDIEAVVGASIGVAVATPGVTTEELLRNADVAMYRAKAAGKGRVELYRPEMRLDVLRQVHREGTVRPALSSPTT